MRKYRSLLSTILVITIWSCNKNCNDYNCFTPPTTFTFELLNKETGENLFTTGELNKNDIQVISFDDQTNIEFEFIEKNNANLISINTIGWETQIVNYSIQASSESLFLLTVDAERLDEDCCSFTRYHNIEITGTEFVISEESGVYQILVE